MAIYKAGNAIGSDPPLDLPLRCRCNHVRGIASEVSPSSGFHFVCYCKDCQAFARFLERPDVLDPAGGTDVFQMPPARLKLTRGMDAVTCQRLSDNVLRWYTDYCQTPIGNTAATPRFPVVAVVHSFMVHRADGRSREEVLGSPLCRIFERPAVGPAAGERARTAIVRVLFRRAAKIFGSVWGLSTTIARAPELCRIQLGRNRCADGR